MIHFLILAFISFHFGLLGLYFLHFELLSLSKGLPGQDLVQQEMRGLDESRREHIRAGGWYSIQVLYTALFAKGFTLDLDNRVLAYEQAVSAGGPFVQNWSNVHWVAYLLGADSNIYLLDSMKPGPEVISEAGFAASLVEHDTYAVNR